MFLRPLKNKKGQGLIEYIILVALMAVATIAVMRVMGQTVSAQFASITYSLQGKQKKVQMEEVRESYHSKKDLGNFMQGAGSSSKRSGDSHD